MIKSRMLSSLVLAALLTGSLTAPVNAAVRLDVTIAPPAPRVVVVPAPRRGYVWAPGYWRWNGRRHVWVEGRWLHVRRGYHWIPERWDGRGERWHFEPGHWERD